LAPKRRAKLHDLPVTTLAFSEALTLYSASADSRLGSLPCARTSSAARIPALLAALLVALLALLLAALLPANLS